jgi:hypothetical protein
MYTIERPLQLGARLAGASACQLRALTAYALPLGEAFQLRDDLLGVFGDPARTGKPAPDDLREGKHTVLTATAPHRADPTRQRLLTRYLGDPDLTELDAESVRSVLDRTGATGEIERLIRARRAQALDALTGSPLRPTATALLRTPVQTATNRAHRSIHPTGEETVSKAPRPHGIVKFVQDMLDSAKELTDGITDRLSAAEYDVRKGLTKLVEPKRHPEPPQTDPSH